ncbi:MAG: serine/threonine-protein kinase PknK, partial [Cyanobacteriota bacterium]|nr:serine/threonine-protein kinase PknK [Cyanobacteriota bacterium]
MIVIPSYKILASIYESSSSIVYRGLRERDNLPVILKVLKHDYPTPQELARYKQEYQITCNLNLEGTVKAYDLLSHEKTLVIILEDFGASSLKHLALETGTKTLSLSKFLNIAIKIAESLGQIHNNHLIHKDLNSSNIVFNPATEQLKIIDFGISTQFNQENPTLKNPNVLEGTLAYISPEQTGRMNRSLDYRTDFYSLGVTFYELLIGQLPFETEDTLELVHCHIAKVPTPPHQINPDIPEILSEIVMKLLAKTAEERYQSAWGIKADLKECLNRLETTGKIESFPLATQDISDKFQIPQKLYGREREVETLLAAFERVAGEYPPKPPLTRGASNSPLIKGGRGGSRVELMLVAGYSGIGKSALVQEIHKPITEKRGYFISGKFDQFQRNIPYSAVVAAFQDLVRQLLTESEEQLNRWREKLLTALGANSRIIIDVIPEIELIIGKQPSVPELGPTESQNRFNFVFQNFIRIFCSREHPLVIFLDDLQWVDSATLKLIQLMMADSEMQSLFLIGAYRNNEVGDTHPLMMALKGLRKRKAAIDVIPLAPLALKPISQLIAETLHRTIESVKPLAELVIKKTRGNPFFVNEFLKTLQAENLLSFKFPQSSLNRDKKAETIIGCWQWNINQIEAKGITDNVVELTLGKLKKLPKSTQKALQFAACVGAYFDLKTLAIVSEKSKTEIFSALTPALQAGLILPTSELDKDLLIQEYKFLHDRVQQAAYASIDESKKQAIHLHMGRLLLQNTPPDALSEKIFEIVDCFNLGIELVTAPKERSRIAKLNWVAGKKAKAATAYDAAVRYLKQGRELLAKESWQREYDLTLNLYVESIEAEYLNANYDEVEALFDVAIARARTTLDKIDVYATKILLYSAKNQMQSAINTGLEALDLLGISMVQSKPQILKVEELYNLPRMTAPDKQAALRILMMLFGPIYTTNPSLLSSLSFTMVALCIDYGNAPLSAYAYGLYGLLLCGVL